MIDNYPYAELFLENDVQKDFIITDGVVSIAGGTLIYNDYTYLLTNDDLKSVPKVYEMLTDEKDLDFGRCNSNYIEFSIAANVIPLIGKNCRVYLWMNNDVNTLFRVGKYKITSDKATADRNYRNIVAYDKLNDMKTADVTAWYNSLFPTEETIISVRQMRTSFCSYFGIDDITDESNMVNDLVTCGKTIQPSDGGIIQGETILRAVCSINGGFGNVSRNGDFRCIVLKSGLIGLYPRVDLYPSGELYPREEVTTFIGSGYYIPPLPYEDYYTEKITKVQIREDDDDLGVAVGEEGNAYILTGNFILFGKGAEELEAIAERLLDKIKGMSYMPFGSVRAMGNPVFEVGDPVRFRTGDTVINTYILKRTLTGTIALDDEYEAVGNQYRDDNSTNIANDVTKLKSKTIKIERNVDRFAVELSDFETDTAAEFAVQSDAINMKVSYGEVSSQLSIEPDTVYLRSNRLVVESSNFTLDGTGNATFSGAVDAATIYGCDIVGSYIYSNGSDSYAELSNGSVFVSPSQASSAIVSMRTSLWSGTYRPEIYVYDGSSNSTTIEAGSINLFNGYQSTMLSPTDITIGGRSVILNHYSSGIESQSGGLALNAPNYDGWVHVGYQSSAVTIGGSSTTLRMLGHGITFQEVQDINGNTVHVLGYE